ncbi:MAG: pepsin-like aspartic protease [Myxococcaceae bacterium]
MPLYVNGQQIPVLLDTGSSNLILIGDRSLCPTSKCSINTPGEVQFSPLPNQQSIGTNYDIFYGLGNGTLSLYSEPVKLLSDGPEIQYDVGVFTQGEYLDNILGLAYESLLVGPSTYDSFWHHYQASQTITDVFAINLCMYNNQTSSVEFGSFDPGVNLQYTDILQTPHLARPQDLTYYTVQPLKLWLDDSNSVAFPAISGTDQVYTIIDSGTGGIFLTDQMLSAIAAYYESAGIPSEFWDNSPTAQKFVKIKPAQYAKLKPMQIEFSSSTQGGQTFRVALSPDSYLFITAVDSNNNPTGYGSLFASTSDVQDSGATLILGTPFMMNAYTVFDRANSRIGLADNTSLCAATVRQPLMKARKCDTPGACGVRFRKHRH